MANTAAGRFLALQAREGIPHEYSFQQKKLSIGSDTGNDLVLRDPSVSRRHAAIRFRFGRWTVTDLESTNGTLINGRKINRRTIVDKGDEIRFGAVRFVLSNPAAATGVISKRPSTVRAMSIRGIFELILIAFVVGFGIAQFLSYKLYREENQLLLAKAVPLPANPVLEQRSKIKEETTNAAPRPPTSAQSTAPKSESKAAAAGPAPTSGEGASAALAEKQNGEDRGNGSDGPEIAVSSALSGMFAGSGTRSGENAEDFNLQDLFGKSVSLSSLRGKVVFLTFWATWCGVCRRELPILQKLQKEVAGKDFVLVAVSVDQTGRESVAPFVERNGYTFPILLDPASETSSKYDVSGIPATFLIGRNGRIVWNGAGGIDWSSSSLRSQLKKLIG